MTSTAATFNADLKAYQLQRDSTPGAYHPTLRLATDLTTAEPDGRPNFRIDDVREIVRSLRQEGAFDRADYMAEYMGDINPALLKQGLKAAIKSLAYDDEGNKRSSVEFQKALTGIYGAVLTGHPTYSMHPDMSRALAELATEKAKGNEDTSALEEKLRDSLELDFEPPSLGDEERQAHATMDNMHAAIDWVEKTAIEVAQEEFPEEWQTVDYMPLDVATWIPFDWDGRADIKWHQLMEKFIFLTKGLDDVLIRLQVIKGQLGDDHAEMMDTMIEDVEQTREKLTQHRKSFKDLGQNDTVDMAKLAEISRSFVEDTDARIIHPAALIRPLQNIIDQNPDSDALKNLVQLRSRLKNHGLKKGGIHFRLNKRSVLNAAAEKKKGNGEVPETSEKSFHIGNVALWKETIMQQMGIAKELLQHFDAHGPIRYLIAECDDHNIVLEALDFAKKIGIDEQIDISPLFEDRDGLDSASKVVDKLFKDPNYLAYIKKRGVASFQLGYSDSGRYDGQIAASRFIERVEAGILQRFAAARETDPELADVGLCFYGTHGDNPGRGAHPASVESRQRYVHTPRILSLAKMLGIKVKHESSFQGQDGNLIHGTKEASKSYFAKAIMLLTKDHTEDVKNDPFYSAYHDEALDFFKEARDTHAGLAHGSGNADLVATFAGWMMQTGSRPVMRDQKSGGARKLPRAIPDNAIKKQLGLMYNMTYGLGTAIKNDPERFERLMRSPAFRECMAAVDYIIENSDPEILMAYIEIYNPKFWQDRASLMGKGSKKEREQCYLVADKLQKDGFYQRFSGAAFKVCADFAALKEARMDLKIENDPMTDPNRKPKVARKQFALQSLHGSRMAYMIDLFQHAVQIPDFGSRHNSSRDELITRIMNYDSSAFDDLQKIFASNDNDSDLKDLDFGKPTDYRSGDAGYHHVADEIINPMRRDLGGIQEVTQAIFQVIPGVG